MDAEKEAEEPEDWVSVAESCQTVVSLPLVTAQGQIRRGKLYLADRKRFDAQIKELGDWDVELEVSRLRSVRSQQANRYYWGVVVRTLSEYTGHSPDETHDVLKMMFLPKHLAILDGNGDVVQGFVLGGSTRQLTTDEFYGYVERVRTWAAETLSVIIPSPGEDVHDWGYDTACTSG